MLVTISRGHLFCRDEGAGPPLLLLHGGALDHRMWQDQTGALADSFRVIAPDFRGHGASSTPERPFRHCDDIAELIQALRLGPSAVVGLSMGGTTALDLALEYPDLVSRVVVVGAGTSEPEFHDPWLLGVLAAQARAAEAGDVGGWVEAALAFAAGPHRQLDEVDPVVVRRLREMIEHTLAAHVASRMPVLPTSPGRTWQRLPTLPNPVSCIGGELDSTDHLTMGRRVARSAPHGSWHPLAGAAHYPNLEQPEQFTTLLRAILADVATPNQLV
jgi:pimeloyl-ACP methyl ester carboxylesterase